MLAHAAAVLVALFVWWFSTGAILWANALPRAGRGLFVVAISVVALASLAGIVAVRDATDAAHAYLGFMCAIGVWGWHEVMFLGGHITGPRTTAAPPPGSGVGRFRAATEVVLYHEIALALTLALIAALSVGAGNTVALVTFAALWAMRLSAKLNVFLGVRNLSEDFLPERLAYVETYFRREPMNPLLPVSVALGLAAAAHLLAPTFGAEPFAVAAGALTATLVLLGVVEHLFMVAPFSASLLWRWAMARAPAPRH